MKSGFDWHDANILKGVKPVVIEEGAIALVLGSAAEVPRIVKKV